jgi:hypothetical protein
MIKPSFCIPMPIFAKYMEVAEKHDFGPKSKPLKTA